MVQDKDEEEEEEVSTDQKKDSVFNDRKLCEKKYGISMQYLQRNLQSSGGI